MAETKDEIAADRDRLAADNEQLRRQLTALGGRPDAPGAQMPQRLFLTEGARQDLAQYGRTTIGGVSMTKEQVEAELAGGPQEGVDIPDVPEGRELPAPPEPTNIRGFDYVYPSVTRGKIDPKVAGTPGINGPAAEPADVEK